MSLGKLFQSLEPAARNDRSPIVASRTLGSSSRCVSVSALIGAMPARHVGDVDMVVDQIYPKNLSFLFITACVMFSFVLTLSRFISNANTGSLFLSYCLKFRSFICVQKCICFDTLHLTLSFNVYDFTQWIWVMISLFTVPESRPCSLLKTAIAPAFVASDINFDKFCVLISAV